MSELGAADALYAEVTDHVVAAGRRLVTLAGRLPDIGGARKQFLTTEDLRIEKELTDLVRREESGQAVFGEEFGATSPRAGGGVARDVWVIDPISSTEAFLRGLPHYAVVATHVIDGRPEFTVVHDPSLDEVFTARRGRGATLDGRPLRVSTAPAAASRTRLVALLTPSEVGTPAAARWWTALAPYDVVRPVASFALSYAWVAAGRYDGVLARTKDAFAEFAGWLLVEEAGGAFRAASRGSDHLPTLEDRWFFGGGEAILPVLSELAARLSAPAHEPPGSAEESATRPAPTNGSS